MNNPDTPASVAKLSTKDFLAGGLSVSVESLKEFFGLMPPDLGMAQADLNGNFLLVNDRFCEITGFAREELLEMRIHNITHEEDLPRSIQLFERATTDGESFINEIRYICKDGSHVWIHNSVSAIQDADGKPKFMLAVALDITGRKQKEEELNYQTTLLKALTESIPDGILIVSSEGQMLYSNQRFLDIWNFPPEVIESQSDELALQWAAGQTMNPAEFLSKVKAIYEQPDREVREELLMKDGRVFDRSGAPIRSGNTQNGWVWTFRDITTRKRTEDNLSEINQRFSATYELAPIGIVESSPDGSYLDGNKQFCAITGYSKKELSQLGIREVTHAEDFKTDIKLHQKLIAGEIPFYQLEKRYIRKDGSIVWCDLFRSAVRDAQGKTLYTIGAVSDITMRKRAEEALRESEESYRILAETASDAIIRIDETSTIQFVNTASERIFGYTMQEMIGQPLTMLMPEEMRAQHHAGFDYYLRTGKRNLNWESIEVPARHKDGHLFPLEISFGEYHRDEKRFFIGIARDISERKGAEELLRESEEKFRNLANSISQFAWMTDASGYIFWYNERWFDYTGTTLEEMQDWGWQKVHHPDEVGRVTEKFKQHIASGEIWEDTFPLRSKTGEYRWFLSRALPIRDENGKILRWFGTNTDIEDVRRAEEKLKDADRRKDEFLATLAHELRNPLAPIRSGLEIIRRSDYDKATIEQTLETVERQTNQIVHLVDDLLEISRITQGKIKLKKGRIELRTAVEMAVETNRELISLNGQDLIISLPDAPVFIDADLTRIAQIILNLINNSAKYTEPGGKIWLTAETKADEVEIRVRDTGIGIPPQMLSGIFEMFTQIEKTGEQARAGLGIGLSVVKSLVEMHGGSITAFSAGEGKGSEFVLILPLAKQQSAISKVSEQTSAKEITQTTENAANNNSGQHRILVVDDNADALEMMKVLLMLENHTVRTALDGETAIEIAPEFQPDVCILDIGLPVMDGYELARRLRETMPDVLLIALTGWGQDDDRIRSSEAGFNHHLVKPVEIEKLQTLLAKMP